jgi:hypothetical protein
LAWRLSVEEELERYLVDTPRLIGIKDNTVDTQYSRLYAVPNPKICAEVSEKLTEHFKDTIDRHPPLKCIVQTHDKGKTFRVYEYTGVSWYGLAEGSRTIESMDGKMRREPSIHTPLRPSSR